MLKRVGITDWDWLLVGDGSGSVIDLPSGWACIGVNKRSRERMLWYGCMSHCTINMAEMMAYIQALNHIALREKDRANKKARRFLNIHIITDSEYCKTKGASGDLMPEWNGALWRVFDDYQRHGLTLHWHWRPRNDSELNTLADAVSKTARELLVGRNIREEVSPDKDRFKFNPDSLNPGAET